MVIRVRFSAVTQNPMTLAERPVVRFMEVAHSPWPSLRILYKTVQSVGSLERRVVR
jgi:hypothetical protein